MKRNVYKSSTRQVIYNAFKECLAEFQAGKMLSKLDDVYGRTAKLTGVSVSSVRRIVDEGMTNGGKFKTPGKHRKGRPKKQIDDFDLCAIRQKVHFFYTVKKEVPTLRKLLAVVKEELNFDGSHELLRQILISIGFKFKKCQMSRLALIEKPAIASKREYYSLLHDTHTRFLRSSENLRLAIPAHSTKFFAKSFTVEAVRLWNSLPETIKNAQSIATFKKYLKEHYLSLTPK